MGNLKRAVTAVVLLVFCSLGIGAAPRCGEEARNDAIKLLKFHVNNDERAELDQGVKQLPSLTNPANKKQKLDVLEVWGYVYKGQYRMRMIYYFLDNKECVLMGQEVLEYARL
jgi:hypothetical protein